MTHYDGYTAAEVIGGRKAEERPPQLGVCRICGEPKEASLDGQVLACINRRDERHRQGAFP